MIEYGMDYSVLILIIGALVLMNMLIQAGLERTVLPVHWPRNREDK
jgi:hypothetical protein